MSERIDVNAIRTMWREGMIADRVIVAALIEILDTLVDIKYKLEKK